MDKQKRQDIVIKVCCVIVSLALWIYIRTIENPMTTQTIRYVPVTIVNEDVLSESSLTLMPDQEFAVNLTVKGSSSIVDNIDKSRDFKLVADLGKYALKPGENRIPVEIRETSTNIGGNITVVNGDSLAVKVNLDNLVSKELAITPKTIGGTTEGFYADAPIISSPVAVVSGAKTYIDKVASITADIDITNANADIDKATRLKALDSSGKEVSNVTIAPDNVQVKVPVKKGKAVEVEVKTTGGTTTGAAIEAIEVNPKKVEIIGNSDVINNIKSITTEPIDLSKISADTTVEARLQLPQGVRVNGDVNTVKVKLTLKKPAQKTFKVTIKANNLGNNLAATLDKTTVEVVLSGVDTELNKITPESLIAAVDLAGLGEGDHTVQVVVSGIPANIQKVSQSVAEVKATIKKTAEVISNNAN